jgi:hypothetical protein
MTRFTGQYLPFSRSILIGFRPIAADHFSQNFRQSRPKPQRDID